jgi:hypothetical protein
MSDLTTREDYVNVKSLKEVTEFSKELKNYIVNQGLYTPIQNKNYVNVEGWEFAGAAMGIFPLVTETINLSKDEETKYQVKVELLRVTDDKVVGTAYAICSSKEKGREKNDEFVILSMAQTRATGKAFRLCIGWVMKLAGYEAVPTEEMPDDGSVNYFNLSPQEKEMTRKISVVRRAMEIQGYDSKESQRAFMKTVLGKLDELTEALTIEAESQTVEVEFER